MDRKFTFSMYLSILCCRLWSVSYPCWWSEIHTVLVCLMLAVSYRRYGQDGWKETWGEWTCVYTQTWPLAQSLQRGSVYCSSDSGLCHTQFRQLVSVLSLCGLNSTHENIMGHAHRESWIPTSNCILTGPSYCNGSNYTHSWESSVASVAAPVDKAMMDCEC